MDAALRKKYVPAVAEQLADLPLNLVVDTRLVETPVKSNPQSEESAAAGDALRAEDRQKQQVAVLCCLARIPGDGVLSRHEISVRTKIDKEVLCWRLDDLVPDLVEKVKGVCRSHKNPKLPVTGYRLTAAGRSRVREVTP